MSCEDHHGCDGIECQYDSLPCATCGVFGSPCECEGEAAKAIPVESLAAVVEGRLR